MDFHIIDDNQTMLNVVCSILEDEGFIVRGFSCPVEYLQFTEQPGYQPPQAIISDVRMPNINGFELVQKIRNRFGDQRFMLFSGYNELHDQQVWTCSQLSKPFLPEELLTKAKQILLCNKDASACVQLGACIKQLKNNSLTKASRQA